VRAVLRREDLAFRYGGEELVVLVRACEASEALPVAERLRAELRARPIALGEAEEQRVITFSGGIASASAKNGFNTADLVARADAALYRAKREGRDRVYVEE
jgi:diguanylate cyclase (GGDEF)-like protein